MSHTSVPCRMYHVFGPTWPVIPRVPIRFPVPLDASIPLLRRFRSVKINCRYRHFHYITVILFNEMEEIVRMDGWQAEFLLLFIEKSVNVGTDTYFEIFRGKIVTCNYRYRQLHIRHICRPSYLYKHHLRSEAIVTSILLARATTGYCSHHDD